MNSTPALHLSLPVLLVLVLVGLGTPQVQAQSQSSDPQTPTPFPPPSSTPSPPPAPISFQPPKVPFSIGAPMHRVGAATRNASLTTQDLCIEFQVDAQEQNHNQLVALVPDPEEQVILTSSLQPTFWFYIPYLSDPDLNIEFRMIDVETNHSNLALVTLATEPGIISVQPNIPYPKAGKQFKWSLTVQCLSRYSWENITFVQGLLQYSPLSNEIKTELRSASPQGQIRILANAGYWEDSLTLLMALRQDDPQDQTLSNLWIALLNQVGLSPLLDQDID